MFRIYNLQEIAYTLLKGFMKPIIVPQQIPYNKTLFPYFLGGVGGFSGGRAPPTRGGGSHYRSMGQLVYHLITFKLILYEISINWTDFN